MSEYRQLNEALRAEKRLYQSLMRVHSKSDRYCGYTLSSVLLLYYCMSKYCPSEKIRSHNTELQFSLVLYTPRNVQHSKQCVSGLKKTFV